MCASYPLGVEDGKWDFVVSVPDICLSLYFLISLNYFFQRMFCFRQFLHVTEMQRSLSLVFTDTG